MRHAEHFSTKEDDIYEGRYACVECETGRQMGTFAHIPPEAFSLYDGHKGCNGTQHRPASQRMRISSVICQCNSH